MSSELSTKPSRKRSLVDAGILVLNDDVDKRKKSRLNETEFSRSSESDDEDMIDPRVDDHDYNMMDIKHNNNNNNNPQLIDLCEQCIILILKYLLPKERIQCLVVCKPIQTILLDEENKIIWNDLRLSLKYSYNTTDIDINGITLPNLKNENDKFKVKVKFIHSQASYSKGYNNCIAIEIDKKCAESNDNYLQNKLENFWIVKCIQNIEIYEKNALIYENYPNDIKYALNNIKYLELDCLYNALGILPKLIKIYPNLCYLSVINVEAGHKHSFYNVLFSQFCKLKCLKYLQFWDCNSPLFERVPNHCFSQIVSLDFSFCSFSEIKHVQNIMNQLKELKYLSFVSNGIDVKNVADDISTAAHDIDYVYYTLYVPDSLIYLKYCSEILCQHQAVINLDLKKLQQTQSLRFVDCCIDGILLLEQISKYCSQSIEYILLNYDRDSDGFLHLHWSKYEIFKRNMDMDVDGLGLQIGINYMEDVETNNAKTQTLKQFLMRTFMYDIQQIITRSKLYANYFRQVVSHITGMAQLNEATDFFQW